MKQRYLLLAIAVILFCQLRAQNNAQLSGKVTEEGGEALIGVNVVIDVSKGWAAVTDPAGVYKIELPAGTYEVHFTYLGKEEQKVNIAVVAGETKTLNLILKEQQQMIDAVVVTGSRYEKKLSEETVSMQVMQGATLTSQNITSLDGGMARVPGVTIADGQVNIRGGSGWSYGAGSRVQVMVDDLPILTADAADAKWSMVPMENVDQVEVIKGAASALYGSGALDGIVNVRTAYPGNEPYVKITAYTGIYGPPTRTPGMKWWGTNNPLSGGANFAYRQKFGQHDLVIGGALDMSSGFLDSSDGHQIRGTIKYRYRVKKVPGLNFGVNVNLTRSWGKTYFFWKGLDSLGYKPYPGTITQYINNRNTIDPFIDYFDKKDNHFKFLGRFFNATNTNTTGQGSVPNLYYAEVQYHRRIQFKKFDFNVLGGVVNSLGDVNPPKNSTGSLFGKNSYYNLSAYAQTDFKFFKRLNISLGARWEYFSQKHYTLDSTVSINGTDTNVNFFQRLDTIQNSLKDLPYPLFRVGLNYQAGKATYIRASFGQGFRYPTIAERYISTSVGPLYISSNPNLKPEKGYSAELGVKQGFKMGKNWEGYGDASFFWNQYDDMMEFTFGQFGPKDSWENIDRNFGLGFSSQNIGKTRILGGEISFAGQGKIGQVGLQFLVGYTYSDPRSLNMHDSLALFNFEGYQLDRDGHGYAGYNSSNNPDTSHHYITYAQTSSSSSNILKYRNRHTFKADVTVSWKGIELNTNLQFASYMENIDYAFVSPLFQLIQGSSKAFSGIEQYRKQKEALAIGKGRGDITWNMYVAYNFKQGVRVALLINNLLNWESTPRPAAFDAPRNYVVQLAYTFKGKAKATKAE